MEEKKKLKMGLKETNVIITVGITVDMRNIMS